jgi:integrase
MKAPIKARGKDTWTFVVELERDAEGDRKRKRVTFHGTRREAEAEHARIVHEVMSGVYVDAKKTTVGEYLDWWLESCVKPKTAPRTHEGYKMIVEQHLKPALGSIRLARLSAMHVQQYESGMLKGGRVERRKDPPKDETVPRVRTLSAQTVLHHHRVLNTALRQAVKKGILLRNPLEAVEPPKPQRRQMQTLPGEQVAGLLAAAEGSRLHAPLQLAVATGMRRGELLGLHWRDADLDAGKLGVRCSLQTLKGEPEPIIKSPKSGKSRTISLPAFAVDALKKHRADQAADKLLQGRDYQDNDLVFCEEDGQPWKPNAFSGLWDRFRAKHGIPYRFHDLRHTCATLMLEAGVHPKVVQEMLGHSTIAITMDLYSHVSPNLQEEAALKLDAILQGSSGGVS